MSGPTAIRTAAAPGAEESLAGTSRTREGRHEERAAWAMALPALTLFFLFFVVPVAMTVYLSFTNARLISPTPPQFVGFDNYVRAFTEDPTFIKSLRNVLFFAVVVVPVQGGLGLLLAILVNQKIRGRNFFRTVYFIPVVTSMVVLSMLWKFIYQENGLLNQIISAVTFGNFDGQAWLQNPNTALGAIIVMSIWGSVGFHMVIWLSGLQTIPETLYEAAELDGCGPWDKFRYVTWPGLRPTFVFVLITITIAALSLFTQVFVMTNGGPLDSTTTLVFHAVQVGFKKQQMGYGAAISLIFFGCVFIVSMIQRRLTKEED